MILLGHGSGGRLSHELIQKHFLPRLGNHALNRMEDSATVGELAITTDSYVVNPRFFPGGDIGCMAVCGTVNDLCVAGADPIALTAAFVLEEGLRLEELDAIIDSMAQAVKRAGVEIVAGDTKVVNKGACDGVFITTSGFGRLDPGFRPSPRKVVPKDTVILSGTLADHGIAVMTSRENIGFKGRIESDVAPLNHLVHALRKADIGVHAMRDPTRGGVAQSLLEIAASAQVRIVLSEEQLPIKPPVAAACEILGLDALYVANEGKLLLMVPEDETAKALEVMRTQPLGRDAAVIGRVEDGKAGCELMSALGGRRAIRMHSGELLPRIC